MGAKPADDALRDLHSGILILVLIRRRLLLASSRPDSGDTFVDKAHRAGGDRAANKACNFATDNAHRISASPSSMFFGRLRRYRGAELWKAPRPSCVTISCVTMGSPVLPGTL